MERPLKYIVRQPGKQDQEFASTRDAVEHLVNHPGYAKLFADNELVMVKGFPAQITAA